jgi:hypothetical protein
MQAKDKYPEYYDKDGKCIVQCTVIDKFQPSKSFNLEAWGNVRRCCHCFNTNCELRCKVDIERWGS